MIRAFVFSGTLVACALCSAQTIYQSTDKSGNPVFTDQPHPNAKPVEVAPTNTTPSVRPTAPDRPQSTTVTGYQTVKMGVPSSIPNGLTPTTVGIELQPSLQPGHRWELRVDGSPVDGGTGTSATIERLERGTHQLELTVYSESGEVVGSDSADVFAYWPGGNNTPPRKAPKAP